MRVNGQTDLTKFLYMSPNNPEFTHYATEAKWEAKRRVDANNMTWVEYEEFIRAINIKIEGKPVKPTLKGFTTYNRLVKDDGMIEYLEEEALQQVLAARETSLKFIGLINHPNFLHGERPLYDYMIEMIRDMSEALKTKDESFWDHYKNLKHHAMWGVAKGIIRREYMGDIAKAINLTIPNEIVILKQVIIDEFTLAASKNKMSLFDAGNNVREYADILDNLPLYIETFLTKPLFEAIAVTKKDLDRLDRAIYDKKIDHQLYTRLRTIIYAHCQDLSHWSKASDYAPIMQLRQCLDGAAHISTMSLFTKKEMQQAYIYAEAFSRHYTNENLIRNILEAALANDLHFLGNVVEVNAYHRDLYFKVLKLLSDYEIISLQQYIEYEKRGRAKFNAL